MMQQTRQLVEYSCDDSSSQQRAAEHHGHAQICPTLVVVKLFAAQKYQHENTVFLRGHE